MYRQMAAIQLCCMFHAAQSFAISPVSCTRPPTPSAALTCANPISLIISSFLSSNCSTCMPFITRNSVVMTSIPLYPALHSPSSSSSAGRSCPFAQSSTIRCTNFGCGWSNFEHILGCDGTRTCSGALQVIECIAHITLRGEDEGFETGVIVLDDALSVDDLHEPGQYLLLAEACEAENGTAALVGSMSFEETLAANAKRVVFE